MLTLTEYELGWPQSWSGRFEKEKYLVPTDEGRTNRLKKKQVAA
jgi:hypothetical protein